MMSIYADVVRPDDPFHQSPPGMKLGRKIEHDSRSLNYPAATALPGCRWMPWLRPKPKTKVWEPRIEPLNQGQLGSCTGNAMVACLSAAPTLPDGLLRSQLTEFTAIGIYSTATTLDSFQGTYPPDDTGSSGLAVMKVAKKLGYIRGYRHAFSITQVITALQTTPVIVGIAWRENMYDPGHKGMVDYSGPVVGGHEICLYGYDASDYTFTFRNSWGAEWGDHGDFRMSRVDLTRALADQGDVTVPVWH